ncbi:MAG: peptidase U32 family protein [Terriglobia bacterium]
MELSVSISGIKLLKHLAQAPFDAFSLGDPFCPDRPGNFLADLAALQTAVSDLKQRSKRVYVATPIVTGTSRFVDTVGILREARRSGADAVEINDVGLIAAARELGLTIHLGPFANVYNSRTAALFSSLGAARIVPSPELSLSEINALRDRIDGEIEIPIHGRQALGIAGSCPDRGETALGRRPDRCLENRCTEESLLSFGQRRIRLAGPATFTDGALVMIEHLPDLINQGYKCFKIEGVWDSHENLSVAGRLYRDTLSDNGQTRDADSRLQALKNGYPDIFNGWYFGTSGHAYQGRSANVNTHNVSAGDEHG